LYCEVVRLVNIFFYFLFHAHLRYDQIVLRYAVNKFLINSYLVLGVKGNTNRYYLILLSLNLLLCCRTSFQLRNVNLMFKKDHAVLPSLKSYNLRNSWVRLYDKIVIYIRGVVAKCGREVELVILHHWKESLGEYAAVPDFNVIEFDVQVLFLWQFDLTHQKNKELLQAFYIVINKFIWAKYYNIIILFNLDLSVT
jgi:hypothetical protein